ncbi:hypothetical protein IMG5_039960 [Ichthyophthirius multifiliis]|uniref:Uncharacterized protein n=1 Tax=Ichthyophthirius multifiliis TaxID=5932 RepID=G0QLZ9_ICHMU|nr:hypothetical protein IMG5_039960 [Ichthyophthirius multifiliis]EGR33756.1 hypothetical protein IMG5_039960 [Ichthyophthirius multifiliis]|eukprot:XP_004038980.1 hypothetical protein IMG5_039960 [Ichthyophthirius multifiliis]
MYFIIQKFQQGLIIFIIQMKIFQFSNYHHFYLQDAQTNLHLKLIQMINNYIQIYSDKIILQILMVFILKKQIYIYRQTVINLKIYKMMDKIEFFLCYKQNILVNLVQDYNTILTLVLKYREYPNAQIIAIKQKDKEFVVQYKIRQFVIAKEILLIKIVQNKHMKYKQKPNKVLKILKKELNLIIFIFILAIQMNQMVQYILKCPVIQNGILFLVYKMWKEIHIYQNQFKKNYFINLNIPKTTYMNYFLNLINKKFRLI